MIDTREKLLAFLIFPSCPGNLLHTYPIIHQRKDLATQHAAEYHYCRSRHCRSLRRCFPSASRPFSNSQQDLPLLNPIGTFFSLYKPPPPAAPFSLL